LSASAFRLRHGLDIRQRNPPRLALRERKPLAKGGETLFLCRPLPVEQRTEPLEVLFQIHGLFYTRLMATIERHVTRQLIQMDATTPCREAAKVMAEKKIVAVAVHEGGRIVGIVTERDMVARVMALGDSGAMPIGEAMRTDLPRIPPTTSENETSEMMRTQYTRHLLVEEQGKVVGIISMRDVIQLMIDDKQFLIDQLQTYIDGR
jgi:CBS domain-containing protein